MADNGCRQRPIGVAVDTRNRAPVFDDQDDDTGRAERRSTTREVAENANGNDDRLDDNDSTAEQIATLRLITWATRLHATDPDPNSDALVYTLSGPDAASFRSQDRPHDGRQIR